MPQSYTPEFKKKIVRLHEEEGRTYKSITAEYGVSKASISKWCSEFSKECQTKALENPDIPNEMELMKENLRLRKELEEAKKRNVYDENANFLNEKPIDSFLYSIAMSYGATNPRDRYIDFVKELTEQERNEIADRCLDNIVADYGNTVLKSSARNEYMIERTRRILRRTVWALQKQLEQGEFQPEGFEVTFGGGRIDRVDIMEDQNKVYVKVIDYKTGNTSFDLVYLYHGLQLQLMIYLDGALRVEQKKYPDKEIIPAGVFYYNIKDPMIQEKIDADVEAVSAGLMKELKMNGLVQADPELVYRMDSSLGSIPVAFNKDGSFRKNSSVADRTQFAVLGRYVRTKIEKIRSSILEGDAEVSPYELGKKNACTYCPYMTVCGFDRRLSGYEFRRLKNFSDEELWKAFDREAE